MSGDCWVRRRRRGVYENGPYRVDLEAESESIVKVITFRGRDCISIDCASTKPWWHRERWTFGAVEEVFCDAVKRVDRYVTLEDSDAPSVRAVDKVAESGADIC